MILMLSTQRSCWLEHSSSFWVLTLYGRRCGIPDTESTGGLFSHSALLRYSLCLSRTEYITIISIMVCMTIFDFVIGVLFGIALACKSLNRYERLLKNIYPLPQASSSSCKIRAILVYAQCIPAIQQFRLYGDQAHTGHTSRKWVGKP